MPRKTIDNEAARQAASVLIDESHDLAADQSRGIVDLFEAAEFETATSKVGGQTISLRRVVLTSPWKVVSHE